MHFLTILELLILNATISQPVLKRAKILAKQENQYYIRELGLFCNSKIGSECSCNYPNERLRAKEDYDTDLI